MKAPFSPSRERDRANGGGVSFHVENVPFPKRESDWSHAGFPTETLLLLHTPATVSSDRPRIAFILSLFGNSVGGTGAAESTCPTDSLTPQTGGTR